MIIWGNSPHGFAASQNVAGWPAGIGMPGIVVTPARGTVPWLFPLPRRRTRKELSLERDRFGIQDEYALATIAQVAQRQAERLEMDTQKRFEELSRELELRRIEFDARYLEALNAERERLIDEEIAQRLRRIMDDEAVILLTLIAAASTL